MTEDEAYEEFKRLRWKETQGNPVCPRCNGGEVYEYNSRRLLKCKSCQRQFAATSGSSYAGRKLPYKTLVELLN